MTHISSGSPPTQFGRYRVVRELGAGGMGKVYEAFDTKLSRTVALKVTTVGGGKSQQQVARFMQEATATAKLRHPHIIALYDLGEEQGQYYFTMDLIEGVTLAQLIKEKKISSKRGAAIMAKVADAIDYAHQQGVIHRDLKPANIMIDKKDEPIVMDFGLAKLVKEARNLTASGTVMGTLAYMPPEQANGSRDIDERSDVYSLGAVLYEILTGHPPFRGSSTLTILHHVLHESPANPRSLNSRVPKELEIIALKALEKTKNKRYKTAANLRDDLERYLAGKPISAKAASPVAHLLAWLRRYKTILIINGIVIIVLSALIGSWLSSPKVSSPPAPSSSLSPSPLALPKPVERTPQENTPVERPPQENTPIPPPSEKTPAEAKIPVVGANVEEPRSIHNFPGGVWAEIDFQSPDYPRRYMKILRVEQVSYMPDARGVCFFASGASQLHLSFSVDEISRPFFLEMVHLSATAGNRTHSPIDIRLNGKLLRGHYNVGHVNWYREELDIRPYLMRGTNTISIHFCPDALTMYWLRAIKILAK